MSTVPSNLAANIELLVPDLNGVPRGKIVQSDSLKSGAIPHMTKSIFFQTVTGGYADIFDEYNPVDGDMLIAPDWRTYRPTPWKGSDFGQVICKSITQTGEDVTFDPRNVLIRLLEIFKAEGLFPVVAPEVEFYLLKPISNPNEPLQPASGVDGRQESGGDSFSIDALDKFSSFVDLVNHSCKEAGLAINGLVHEMGPSQIELNVNHGEALNRADQLFLLERTIKACALKTGHTATFMAKPLMDCAGSGCHLHMSMNDAAGYNIFSLKNGLATEKLLSFIAGLQAYLPHAFALLAPSINSYKRFVPELSAPLNLEWGYDNRTAGFRIPFDKDFNGRVESRISGADANPYLFIAVSLACGLLGLQQKLTPRDPTSVASLDISPSIPPNLPAALISLENFLPIADLLGKDIIKAFVSVKQAEIVHFSAEITPWEKRYLAEAL